MTNDTVRVESGLLAGARSADGTVCSFKGVPYAEPPVGPLRWKPPQPPQPWSGIRPATAFGPRCIQPNRPTHAVGYFGPEPESEDCLTLNIWTAARAPDEKRPVMVWFHGGAFLVGSGSLPIFHGDALARRGVVLVTVNYRLGRLGFLAHPELSAEQSYRGSGNYGHLDQIEALRWIKANIAAFGGDPDRVTIFGQSAGSSTVNTLMASPLAKGLFQRAIGQSGGSFFAHVLPQLDVAEKAGLQFARALGAEASTSCAHKPAREIQFARPPDDKLIELYDANDAGGIDRATAWPIIDGHLLKPNACSRHLRAAHRTTCRCSPARPRTKARPSRRSPRSPSSSAAPARNTATWPTAFLKAFPANSDAEAEQAGRRIDRHPRVQLGELDLGQPASARPAAPASISITSTTLPPKPIIGDRGDLSRDIGVFHTAEIPYVFQTLDARPWPWRDEDRALSDMMAALLDRTSPPREIPNGPGLPAWPRFDPQTADHLASSTDGIRVGRRARHGDARILDSLRPANSTGDAAA